MRETGSDDGGSTTSRKRKEPLHDDYRDKDRDREREKDRDRERERGGDREKRDRDSHRDRDKERDRVKDYERSSRSSRHHHRYEEYDERRPREYTRGEREKDSERDKDRDGYKSSKYHRDGDEKKKDKDGKERVSKSRVERGSSLARDWESTPKRERSDSVYKEDSQKRELPEDKSLSDRADKVCLILLSRNCFYQPVLQKPRYERAEEMDVDKRQDSARAETPEEGEI